MSAGDQRIAALVLDESSVPRRRAEIEDERAAAISDLLSDNYFSPKPEIAGPFHLRLRLSGDRLMFELRDQADARLAEFHMALRPFRAIIKDYVFHDQRPEVRHRDRGDTGGLVEHVSLAEKRETLGGLTVAVDLAHPDLGLALADHGATSPLRFHCW